MNLFTKSETDWFSAHGATEDRDLFYMSYNLKDGNNLLGVSCRSANEYHCELAHELYGVVSCTAGSTMREAVENAIKSGETTITFIKEMREARREHKRHLLRLATRETYNYSPYENHVEPWRRENEIAMEYRRAGEDIQKIESAVGYARRILSEMG